MIMISSKRPILTEGDAHNYKKGTSVFDMGTYMDDSKTQKRKHGKENYSIRVSSAEGFRSICS